MQVNDVTIRLAISGDEAEIANVHLNSWREAYRGLLPQVFLDQLPHTFKRRMLWWRKVITEGNDPIYVAEAESGIVGFACFGSGRDEDLKDQIEVRAIYLLKKIQGKGVGFALLRAGFQTALERNFQSGYCWVLEDNPTIKFYERAGAQFQGRTKDAEIGRRKVKERAYFWKDLESFR